MADAVFKPIGQFRPGRGLHPTHSRHLGVIGEYTAIPCFQPFAAAGFVIDQLIIQKETVARGTNEVAGPALDTGRGEFRPHLARLLKDQFLDVALGPEFFVFALEGGPYGFALRRPFLYFSFLGLGEKVRLFQNQFFSRFRADGDDVSARHRREVKIEALFRIRFAFHQIAKASFAGFNTVGRNNHRAIAALFIKRVDEIPSGENGVQNLHGAQIAGAGARDNLRFRLGQPDVDLLSSFARGIYGHPFLDGEQEAFQ